MSKDSIENFFSQQEQLGAEFTTALFDNIEELYVETKPKALMSSSPYEWDIKPHMLSNGYVIAVDGIDGSGKTTVISILKEILSNGYFSKVQNLKIPKAMHVIKQSDIGKAVYKMAIDHRPMSDDSNALFMAAAIEDTIQNHVLPRINEGENTILDRWISSYLAHQYRAENIRLAPYIYDTFFKTHYESRKRNRLVDLYIYCYTDHETSLDRLIKDPIRDVNHIDLKPKKYREKVISGFDEYYQEFEGNKILIDTRTASVDDIKTTLEDILVTTSQGQVL